MGTDAHHRLTNSRQGGANPEGTPMVPITRLNNTVLVVNADMIESLESTPDTIVTLTTGRKVVARESVEEIIEKVVEYKRRCLQLTPEVRSRQG